MPTYTAFTPPNSTPSTTPPTPFSVAAQNPSTTPPVAFFPQNGQVNSLAELSAIPTVGVTPADTLVVAVLIGAVTSEWQLKAGTLATDATHQRPQDYNAGTNAKYWLQIASH
jgi:hypothetical protein